MCPLISPNFKWEQQPTGLPSGGALPLGESQPRAEGGKGTGK